MYPTLAFVIVVAVQVLWRCDAFLVPALPSILGSRRCPSTCLVPHASSARAAATKQKEESPVLDGSDEEDASLGWRQEQWDKNIADLIKYNETFGTVNVPGTHRHIGDEYSSLANFVKNVREYQGLLSEERHAQLTALGFSWVGADQEKLDQQWEEMFQRLVEYRKVHRNCNVPFRWDEEEPNSLGFWVYTQRRNKKMGILSEKRTNKLNSIGFVWELRSGGPKNRPDLDALWEQRRQELIQYHKENGHYWVRRDYKNKNNRLNPLANWANNQRQLYQKGNLQPDREALLNEIGFPWDAKSIRDQQWEEKFQQVKEIVQGSTAGEVYTKKVLGRSLYDWVYNQRQVRAKGTLDAKRKRRLNEIGFEWIQVTDK